MMRISSPRTSSSARESDKIFVIADELGYTRAAATASLSEPRLRSIRAGLGLWHVNFRAVVPALAELVAPLWDQLVRRAKHSRAKQIQGGGLACSL